MSVPDWATDMALDDSLPAERVHFKYRKNGMVQIILKLTNGDVAFATLEYEDLLDHINQIKKGYRRLLAGDESEQKTP